MSLRSLSSRRAWIEIINPRICLSSILCRSPRGERGLKLLCLMLVIFQEKVALLAESVDWNSNNNAIDYRAICRSPRGERGLKYYKNWIRIWQKSVALLAESVDWNLVMNYIRLRVLSRSPRGERGLKSGIVAYYQANYKSLSSRRAWIEITSSSETVICNFSRSPRGERGLKYQSL